MLDHCEVLLYLDKKKHLVEMQSSCKQFVIEQTELSWRQFPPLRYRLDIDMMQLLNDFPYVGKLLLDEPMKWQDICVDILFTCIQTIHEKSEELPIHRAQMTVILNIKCLPQNVVEINPRHYRGLTYIQGVLLEISKSFSYVIHSVWNCPEDCEGSEKILHYIPKSPPRCYVCKTVLFENSAFRRCADQVIGTFMMEKDFICKRIKISDEHFNKLKLGARHNLVVVIVKKTTFVWAIEAVNDLPAPSTIRIAKDIADLFVGCKGTPWTFIYCLASSIGMNVCPLNCFMPLKICLLLSLTSVAAHVHTGCSILHVLAAGLDTGYASSIMTAAANLATTSICLGTSHTSVSTALLASSGGVCLLPLPLHTYQQKQISELLRAMESGEVTAEYHKVNFSSAVWSQGMNVKKIVLFNVANIFGTVCRGDFGDNVDDITEFQLLQAVECAKADTEEKRVLHDLKNYINSVAGIHVELTKETEELLKTYFLAARKNRPQEVSASTMGALVSISLASARLCRRMKVNEEDAIFAIWLHVCGSSEPRSAPEEYLQTPTNTKLLHSNMKKFKEWLDMFIRNVLYS